jgi:hypothetical protein
MREEPVECGVVPQWRPVPNSTGIRAAFLTLSLSTALSWLPTSSPIPPEAGTVARTTSCTPRCGPPA